MFQQTRYAKPPTTLTMVGVIVPTIWADLHAHSSLLSTASSTHQRALHRHGAGGTLCLFGKRPPEMVSTGSVLVRMRAERPLTRNVMPWSGYCSSLSERKS